MIFVASQMVKDFALKTYVRGKTITTKIHKDRPVLPYQHYSYMYGVKSQYVLSHIIIKIQDIY